MVDSGMTARTAASGPGIYRCEQTIPNPLMEELLVTIKIEKAVCGPDWLVRLDNYPVTFRSMAEAMEFADTLKSRIEAPHPLPVVA
jgi:hypothetical protein